MRIMRWALLGILVCAEPIGASVASMPSGALKAFSSDKQLVAFLKLRAARQRAKTGPILPPPPAMVMTPPAVAPSAAANEVVLTGARAATPSITNTQEKDVDEGGIVKVHGDCLVVLRRGRLFTISIANGAMRTIDHINAFPPGTSGNNAWYDEMLVSDDRVIVVGYSYGRGGTEINRFRISADGYLRFEDSYHLRSNDYYSSSNYASRLIGSNLIFYTPLDIDPGEPILPQLPGLSRWTGKKTDRFERIAPAARIYVPEPVRRDADADIDTLHTVTVCDLAAARLACRATGVLGSGSRDFYVSGNAAYVWISDAFDDRRRDSRSMLYRLPLDGSRPGAVQTWGGPVDQFSFQEDRERHALNILVRAGSGGERMWRAEMSEGEAALLHLPLALFGDGSRAAPVRAYRSLPINRGQNWSFHNRFVGQYLVYSAGEFAAGEGAKTVFVAPINGGPVARIRVPHAADRIDIMGSDAVVIGNDAHDRLGFTAIELAGGPPRIGDTSLLTAAREGERRSQAFFYRSDPDSPDGSSGMLGLPITRDLGETPVARFLGAGSAVAFLRRDARRFTPAGELAARAQEAREDGCQASCVDWYGNARPIFLGARLFALMGYELVEGRAAQGRVRELARLDFALPPAKH